MFADIRAAQTLFSTSWPLIKIDDNPGNSGNAASGWNRGTDFGGGAYRTMRGGGSGAYGNMGVDDQYPIALEGGDIGDGGVSSETHPMGCWAMHDKVSGKVC